MVAPHSKNPNLQIEDPGGIINRSKLEAGINPEHYVPPTYQLDADIAPERTESEISERARAIVAQPLYSRVIDKLVHPLLARQESKTRLKIKEASWEAAQAYGGVDVTAETPDTRFGNELLPSTRKERYRSWRVGRQEVDKRLGNLSLRSIENGPFLIRPNPDRPGEPARSALRVNGRLDHLNRKTRKKVERAEARHNKLKDTTVRRKRHTMQHLTGYDRVEGAVSGVAETGLLAKGRQRHLEQRWSEILSNREAEQQRREARAEERNRRRTERRQNRRQRQTEWAARQARNRRGVV